MIFKGTHQLSFILTLTLGSALFFSGCNEPKGESNDPVKEVEPEVPETPDAPVESAPKSVEAPKPEVKPSEPVVAKKPEKKAEEESTPEQVPMKKSEAADTGKELATLGGGCFWCTEAVMERLEGVSDVVSGYMGGHVESPTYEQVCTKTTGHAEVIQITFDPAAISFDEILDVFWQAHDPTTLNQQGADRGPQYRSVVYYHSAAQKNAAEQSKSKLDASGKYDDPAVTEISKADTFWVAEDGHQDYYELNKDSNPYCRVVISPKLKKLGME